MPPACTLCGLVAAENCFDDSISCMPVARGHELSAEGFDTRGVEAVVGKTNLLDDFFGGLANRTWGQLFVLVIEATPISIVFAIAREENHGTLKERVLEHKR